MALAAFDNVERVQAAVTLRYTTPGAERLVALQQAFRSPIGQWQAGDIPHPYALPDGTTIWVLNDSFLSTSPDGPIRSTSLFVRNAAFVENRNSELSLLESRHSYLTHGEELSDRWWWFHGGHVHGRCLDVVTTEMLRTGPLGWGLNFEPTSTWITTIESQTRRFLRMQPAPNSGVNPVYGFSVASDYNYTYLYGNNHLYGRDTTENRVARVPRGRLLATPTYWNGETWTTDPSTAISVLSHGTYACRLYVFRHGTRWLATAKEDEFYGTDVLLFEAPKPTGPWSIIQRFTPPTKTGDTQTCTYDGWQAPSRPAHCCCGGRTTHTTKHSFEPNPPSTGQASLDCS